jgi:hypothetical protein
MLVPFRICVTVLEIIFFEPGKCHFVHQLLSNSIQTDSLFYSVSDFHLKAGRPVQCESELKMSCDSASLVDMRHLSNELIGICEEEFWNKLESVLRNLVDKSET